MNMPGLSDALRSRLASLLATEFSKKVSRKAALSVAVRRAALGAGSPPVLKTLTQQAVRGSCLKEHCTSNAELQRGGLGGKPNGRDSTCRDFSFSRLPGAMQVYVTVYADGPTRVLRFADERSVAFLESEQSIIDLAARLNQVCAVLLVSHLT